MNGWMILWKIVFIAGVSIFAGMAVWVTIGGFADIKRLFERIKEEHAEGDGDDEGQKEPLDSYPKDRGPRRVG